MATSTESKDSVFTDIERIGKLSKDGVFVYDITADRFTYLNDSLIKIIEVNKKEIT